MSRWRFFSSRVITHQPMTAATVTTRIIRVASALILGLTPRRTDENTFIGSVVDEVRNVVAEVGSVIAVVFLYIISMIFILGGELNAAISRFLQARARVPG